ncbi:MAG: AraC family transcriptional regulator [Ruminococcaceae bacterium]|nr:AraC family transcriptional regulator [Oscillospiraceae bacterium]
MKVNELVETLKLDVVTNGENLEKEVDGCYIGDLLSWVMGRADENNVWVTIMSNINIVAVATLTGASCILLCEGVTPEKNVIDKADAQDVVILRSDKTAFELAVMIDGVLK